MRSEVHKIGKRACGNCGDRSAVDGPRDGQVFRWGVGKEDACFSRFDTIAVSCLVGAVYGSCLKREVRSRVIHVSQGGHAVERRRAELLGRMAGVCSKRAVPIPPPSHWAARRRGRGKGCCSFFPLGRLRQCLLTHLGLRLSVDFVPACQGKQRELTAARWR